MRDRLIELLTQQICRPCVECKYYDAELKRPREYCAAESRADHLLADGWIRPPCKVGDTVYKVVNDKRVKRPYECEVVGFWFSKDENCNNAHLVRYVNGVFDCSFSVPFTDFGKTVFLAKEEAEQALKERENNGC